MAESPKNSKVPEPTQTSVAAAESVLELQALIEAQGVARQPPAPATADSVVGEVIETHHPHRPGRVCVRWIDAHGVEHVHWLAYNAGLRLEQGQRVVLSRPSNWPEWLVLASLSQAWRDKVRTPDTHESQSRGQVLRLEEADSLLVESAQGVPMFELARNGDRPVLRINQDLNLEIEGAFRVQAGKIELRSGQRGIDLRSEGDAIVRGQKVIIN